MDIDISLFMKLLECFQKNTKNVIDNVKQLYVNAYAINLMS